MAWPRFAAIEQMGSPSSSSPTGPEVIAEAHSPLVIERGEGVKRS